MSRLHRIGVVLLIVALAAPASAFMLVGGAGAPVMVMDDCCKVMLKPVPATYLPAGGADAMGQRATVLADYPGIAAANVVLGAAAPGTLTIDLYGAALYGADFIARYEDGAAGATWTFPPPFPGGMAPSYRWIQEINTNMPLGGPGGVYIDPRPNDDPGGLPLPYYWTDPEAMRHTNGVKAGGAYDLRFRDFPRRPCKNTHTTWCADLFLVSENRFTVPGADPLHVITIHDGVRWGFEIWPKKIGKRHLTLTETLTPLIDISWSQADYFHNLMGTTYVATTYPGGIFTPAGMPPPPDQVVISDPWPPVNIPPDNIIFRADFFHPIIGQPAFVEIEILQLDLVSSFPIVVPVVYSPADLNLQMKIDLTKDSVTVMSLPQLGSDCCVPHDSPGCDNPQCASAVCNADPFCCDFQWDQLCADFAQQLCGPLCAPKTGNREDALNQTRAVDDWSAFNPAAHGLQIAGQATFELQIEFVEHPRGDMNGDLKVDGLDITKFAETLLDPAPDPNLVPFGDFDMTGTLDDLDIADFVDDGLLGSP